MLSRTADHLFWMSRYTQRAENTARMLNVSYETSLLPQSAAVGQRTDSGLYRQAGQGHARAGAGVHGARRQHPLGHPVVPARRARERARRARSADHRSMGNAEPDLAGTAPA